jgi:hypothetical protein
VTNPCFCGVDPGLRGGISFLRGDEIECFDIPLVDREINIDEMLRLLRDAKPASPLSNRPDLDRVKEFRRSSDTGQLLVH